MYTKPLADKVHKVMHNTTNKNHTLIKPYLPYVS